MFRCSGTVVAVGLGLGVWRLAFGALMDDGMSALWAMIPSAASFAQSHLSRPNHYPHSSKVHNGRVGRSPLSRSLPASSMRMPLRVTNPKMAFSFSLSTLYSIGRYSSDTSPPLFPVSPMPICAGCDVREEKLWRISLLLVPSSYNNNNNEFD
jgi:hypothetical protein